MKIVTGCLYHETNTFNPFPTNLNHFVITEGEEVLERLASTEVLKERGATVIPSIYATALSSGLVTKEAYQFIADKIITVLKEEPDIDGVWLHLHGSMVVEGIGSGERALLKEIREVIGNKIPISLTLDIHANIALDFHKYVNIVRAYRTVPHEDQLETERITAGLLMDCLENNMLVKPSFIRVPMIICGEKALGASEPLRTIFEKLEEVESRKGISTASFFLNHAWSDSENTATSVFVTPQSVEYETLAENVAKELASFVFEKRHEFDFEAIALEPDEAIEKALGAKQKPVFISDSGDNTTAGAAGMGTYLLQLIKNKDIKDKKIVVATIFDDDAFKQLNAYKIGDSVSVEVGKNIDEYSMPVKLTGTLKTKGDLLGYLNATDDKVGDVCTVSVGNIDVVIANRGESFITINHFIRAGLNIDDYDIIVIKQGYLFPELSKKSKMDILALTPGATYLILEKLDYQKRPKPVFPMEKDVKLSF